MAYYPTPCMIKLQSLSQLALLKAEQISTSYLARKCCAVTLNPIGPCDVAWLLLVGWLVFFAGGLLNIIIPSCLPVCQGLTSKVNTLILHTIRSTYSQTTTNTMRSPNGFSNGAQQLLGRYGVDSCCSSWSIQLSLPCMVYTANTRRNNIRS